MEGKAQVEDLLKYIFPPREYTENGIEKIQYISTEYTQKFFIKQKIENP